MNLVTRTLELDSNTDLRLRELAEERGQDVAAVLAEAVALLDSFVDFDLPDLSEDVRRRDDFLRTRMGVPLDEVKTWVASWGGLTSCRLPNRAGLKITLSPEAILDIKRLRLFLETINPEAAKLAPDRIWTALEKLDSFPFFGVKSENPDVRQMFVQFGNSGYVVRYFIDPISNGVTITRIWHSREARP